MNIHRREGDKYSLNSTLIELLKNEDIEVNALTLAKNPLPRPSWINTAPGKWSKSKTFFSPQLKMKNSLKVSVVKTPALPVVEEKAEKPEQQKRLAVPKVPRLLNESTVSLYCDAHNDY